MNEEMNELTESIKMNLWSKRVNENEWMNKSEDYIEWTKSEKWTSINE